MTNEFIANCDETYMHGRTKDFYSSIFSQIKEKYNLTILDTTNNGISAIKLDYK